MRIDAHQHYWTMSRTDYGWITPDLPTLHRDFMPEDLEIHLKKHHIDGTIVVQAAPTIEETEYLFQLADRSPSIIGVVGWLDLFDSNHIEQFERYRKHPKFVGFRLMIQEMNDASRVLDYSFVEALQYYAKIDIPVDLLVRSPQLEVLNELLDAVPDLRGVIDHIGKPRIIEREYQSWADQLERAAKHEGIYCKLSGIVTEADHHAWKKAELTPYIEHALQCFGVERVMFGSDWPVCLLAASYDEVVEVLEESLAKGWNEQDKAKLFGDNAKRFYKLL